MPANGYGAVSSARNGIRAAHDGADEEQSLLRHSSSKSRWRSTLTVDVSRDWADVVLLLCYIITGLLDSAAVSTWGSFVSMQTGKTMFSPNIST